MNILQVFDFLSPPKGGGSADVVYNLSLALSQRGHKVTLCIGDYELDTDYVGGLQRDVDIQMCRSYLNRYGLYLMPGLVKLDVRGYDVIHLHCYRSIQNAIICHKAKRHGIPYVIDAHGSTVDVTGVKQLLRKTYDRLTGYDTLKHASCLIAETEVGAAEYLRLGADRNKIVVMHPLLDISEFAMLPEKGSFRRRYGLPESFLVLFIGRIHQAKGIGTLVETVQQLTQNWRKDVRLVVVGQDNGYGNTLKELIAEKDLTDRVLFTGFLTGAEKLAAMVDADILVQPSRNEAGARPSLEAILCGTPMAVTSGTGAGEMVASFDGGYLFDYGDSVRLAHIVRYVMSNPHSAFDKVAKARRYIEDNLSLEKQIGQYEELYRRVL